MPHVVTSLKTCSLMIITKDAAIVLNVSNGAEIIDDAFLAEFDMTGLRRAEKAGEGDMSIVIQRLIGETEK